MNTIKLNKGQIVMQGMGGFLNPPTHPEHTQSVQFDLRRKPENRGSASLSAAVDCEWLDNATRAAARTVLNSWKRPAIESAEIQNWIRQVLGYFKGCYRKPGNTADNAWNVDQLDTQGVYRAMDRIDDHAGVHLIRKYYPEFVPTPEHFSEAYWGTKP